MAAVYFTFLLLLVGLVHGNKTDENAVQTDKRISGGSFIVGTPSQVRIKCSTHGEEYFCCSGVLISPVHVLTVANCLFALHDDGSRTLVDSVIVQLGKNLLMEGQVIRSSAFRVHENFTGLPTEDIAVIRLPTPAIINAWVRPVTLPFGNHLMKNFYTKWTLLATGWGEVDDYETTASTPMSVWMQMMPKSACTINGDDNPLICATNYVPYNTICLGDEGGPLTVWPVNVLVGLSLSKTAVGNEQCGCRCRNTVNIFLDVRHHLPWIRSHMY